MNKKTLSNYILAFDEINALTAVSYNTASETKQSEDEAAAAEQKATMDKLTQENADLKRSMALSEKKAKLLAMGYDEKLADDTATAMVDGDMDKVMANQTNLNNNNANNSNGVAPDCEKR